MRKPFYAAILLIAFAAAVAPRGASACLSFDYNRELAAIDEALKTRPLSAAERTQLRALRLKAVKLNRQANALNDGEKILARNAAMSDAMKILKLDRIVSRDAPSDGVVPQNLIKGCS